MIPQLKFTNIFSLYSTPRTERVLPRCSWVYCAQLDQLLALDTLDCPAYCSGCPILPSVYVHQNQGIYHWPLPQGFWHPPSLCCAGHNGVSLSKAQFSRAFVLPSGWSTTFPWPCHWLAKQVMTAAGVAGNFLSYSFCIGATTVAACNGVSDHVIQASGCGLAMPISCISKLF